MKKTQKKAAEKPKRSFSPAQKAAQMKVKKVNLEAVKSIYEAGKAGKPMPTWGKSLKDASKKVYNK
ncbi:hypothetical protein COLO4_02543 [Corchorus olitorius]|uniref:Uncharacterized protein n=1 Tax=Corchorus olitorius TaxID=93759 RepID=A0A1R3L0R6_9ROSI|nr:hypothetical protein COLO4_02543 [Corchorus olitorius]